GAGRIGSRVSELLQPFGCRVSYFDPHVSTVPGAKRCRSLHELLSTSDVVSLHARATEGRNRSSTRKRWRRCEDPPYWSTLRAALWSTVRPWSRLSHQDDWEQQLWTPSTWSPCPWTVPFAPSPTSW
ncbi:hypothetical protein FK530_25110, partial [Tsukamurella conjunctivitidis]